MDTFKSALTCVLMVMAITYFAIAAVGLYTDRQGTYQTFYAPEIDATCIESFDGGKMAMFCFRGKVGVEGVGE